MNRPEQRRIEQAKKHLNKIRELVAQKPSPFEGMTEEETIEKIRKVREEIWEKKVAITTRHK